MSNIIIKKLDEMIDNNKEMNIAYQTNNHVHSLYYALNNVSDNEKASEVILQSYLTVIKAMELLNKILEEKLKKG